jgi:predicted nucleic acid-binding protein
MQLVLLDTNILVRWVHRGSPDYNLVTNAVADLVASDAMPCYCSQNIGEFWNVLTRPTDRNGYGLSPLLADQRATDIEQTFRFLPDSHAVHSEWRRLLVVHSVCGAQVHDARIAAIMWVHEVKRILTFNVRDFARFTDIEAIHPAQLT